MNSKKKLRFELQIIVFRFLFIATFLTPVTYLLFGLATATGEAIMEIMFNTIFFFLVNPIYYTILVLFLILWIGSKKAVSKLLKSETFKIAENEKT